jgi:hypothetical protein
MSEIREAVRRVFQADPPRPFSTGELADRLDLDFPERRALRKALRFLCRDGTLRRTRGGAVSCSLGSATP